MNNSYKTGFDIEIRVINFLEKQGYKLISHRYKTKYGEVDIIMYDNINICLVAIEVKYRKEIYNATESISLRQIKRICDTMGIFISENTNYLSSDFRIDAIFTDGKKLQILKNITI